MMRSASSRRPSLAYATASKATFRQYRIPGRHSSVISRPRAPAQRPPVARSQAARQRGRGGKRRVPLRSSSWRTSSSRPASISALTLRFVGAAAPGSSRCACSFASTALSVSPIWRYTFPSSDVRFGQVGIDRQGAPKVGDGSLVGKTVAQVPGELRAREMRLGLVWVDRKRPLDLEERLLFKDGVSGLVEKPLRVRAGERRARQREVGIRATARSSSSIAATRSSLQSAMFGVADERPLRCQMPRR